MGHRDKAIIRTESIRRWMIDVVMLVAMGVLLGFLGPFDSDSAPPDIRYAYWILCMLGGGLIAIAVDEGFSRGLPVAWKRVAAISTLATPLVALFVLTIQCFLFGEVLRWSVYLQLLWQVWPIMLAAMAVRALVWRRLPVRVEARTIIAPPLPEAEAVFRRRLSAKRRGARLIAIEAHDHYLKVHTDAGAELITLRFSDAMKDLAQAHGWRVHRSWWVAADAIEEVRWRRGGGELRLVGDLIAPVSRTYSAQLKEAGWF
ncbi:LytTr DNA-binding domain protein [compost metagenome]